MQRRHSLCQGCGAAEFGRVRREPSTLVAYSPSAVSQRTWPSFAATQPGTGRLELLQHPDCSVWDVGTPGCSAVLGVEQGWQQLHWVPSHGADVNHSSMLSLLAW